MIINNHILHLSNVYYDKQFIINNSHKNVNNFINNFVINNKIYDDNKIITIDNIFVIDTLDSCFSHAVIDKIFPIFWALQDIKKYDINFNNFYLFIYKKNIFQYPENLRNIEESTGLYKNVYHDLISLVNDKYIFEHLIQNDTIYFIKNCYFYILNDKWQRSPWNCVNYYPNRKIPINKIIYNDEQIYYQLKLFVSHVKNKYNILENSDTEYNTIIIERKNNRFFDKVILDNIIENVKNNCSLKFNGIKILEDMTLYQQIKLFSENKVFIFRHGSCLTNLLWIPTNSIIFDIDIETNRKEIVKRIAKVSNSTVFSMNYNHLDYEKFKSNFII
jgi:hypothetical protein